MKHPCSLSGSAPAACLIAFMLCVSANVVGAGDPTAGTQASQVAQNAEVTVSQHAALPRDQVDDKESHPQAVKLLQQVLQMITYGPAFDAKVRETIWTTGREVVGVGTYEQAGGGSGRYNLQITMHDGDGKHRLQQISDGRLAWTRTEIAGKVSLRRVDVGRLDQWVRGATQQMRISPGLRVGAWGEMLSTIQQDYTLRLAATTLRDEPVWVLLGDLREDRRQQIMAESGRGEWPVQCPTRVRVAIRSKSDPQTGFGQLLPIRIEFWSDPDSHESSGSSTSQGRGRLITLIELYSIRLISPPPPERFRYDNQEAEVNFANETDQYIQQYGVQLTERQKRQLKR